MADEVWALDGRTTWHRPPGERADDAKRELSAARAEIDRLTRELDGMRDLPVIAACGECARSTDALVLGRGLVYLCDGDREREVVLDGNPPKWCPLRGAR